MSSENAIIAHNLSKHYAMFAKPIDRLKQGLLGKHRKFYHEFQALQNVSFTIKRGETVGIIGKNGSGKSTLLQLICGTVPVTSGSLTVNGRISALLELGTGFNPEFTGKENIYLNAAILGLSKKEIEEKYDAIVAFADIGKHLHQPVKTYSSGMYVRLAFAVAVAVDPDILVVDEALSVGDEAFQRKCFARIRQIQQNGGTILFVSHGASTIIEICNRAIFLDGGEVLCDGTPKTAISRYHKLIYAPLEKQATIREELKAEYEGKTTNIITDETPVELIAEEKLTEHFIPGLIPQSTVIYEENGAFITNPRILNKEGNQVNALERGKRYSYCYDITFHECLNHVRFGMLVRMKSGVNLSANSTSSLADTIEKIEANTTLTIRFDFSCLLTNGTYFLNAGCTAEKEGKRIYPHRITDACMFMVLPEGDSAVNGPVDFLVESHIQQVNIDEKIEINA